MNTIEIGAKAMFERQRQKLTVPLEWEQLSKKAKDGYIADVNAVLNSTRERVNLLEAEMKKQPQIELEVKHHFSYGIYARELFIPKGVMLTGKIHKYEQFNILTKGEISVLVGDEIKRVKAPFTIVSEAGTKRIAIAHEDCIWITIHGTHERDLDKIEEYFIAQNEKEYLEFCGQMDLLKVTQFNGTLIPDADGIVRFD